MAYGTIKYWIIKNITGNKDNVPQYGKELFLSSWTTHFIKDLTWN